MTTATKIMCKSCNAPTASECICDNLNFSESLTPKAKRWIKAHSAVDLANVASAKTMLKDLPLQIELQGWVFGVIGVAMIAELGIR